MIDHILIGHGMQLEHTLQPGEKTYTIGGQRLDIHPTQGMIIKLDIENECKTPKEKSMDALFMSDFGKMIHSANGADHTHSGTKPNANVGPGAHGGKGSQKAPAATRG